jgi:hypothetical protein
MQRASAPVILLLIALLLFSYNAIAESQAQCRKIEAQHVLYNRVPKAASTSLKTLAANRAEALAFLYVSSRVFNDRGP